MSERLTRRRTLGELLRFAFPVMAGQLGLMLIGAGDMLIATQHSTVALAAIGLSVAFANPVFVVGLAFQFAISPLVARRRGEGKSTAQLATSSLVYALLLSLPFALLTWLAAYLVPLMEYSQEITVHVVDYIRITALSIPGAFVYTSLREWLQAHERTWLANGTSLVAVLLNLWFNWALVFGHHGFPALGVNGLAWASCLVRWSMGLALLLPLLPVVLKHCALDRTFIREAWQLGGPTAVAFFFEVTAFCSVTMFVGKFGDVQTAANSLALTLASCTFMIPMAISSAVGVKVGHAYGEKNLLMLKRYAWTGLALSVGFMACSGLVFSLIPAPLLGLFGPEAAVLAYGIHLLFWVAVFQVFDGAQVTLAAILRGVGISRPVSVVVFVGYWLIGIPMGYYLAHAGGWQGQGLWIGLATSLGLVAVTLFTLAWRRVHAIA